MNPQTFLYHFERLTDASGSVPRLRELILQLAVQGKLVPQDERDEPAARLYENIQKEKARLIKKKEITRDITLPPINVGDEPFIIPNRWKWVRLGEVAQVIMGQSPPGISYNCLGEGIPLINGPVEFGKGLLAKTIRTQFTTEPTKFCKENDLLLCVRGSTTGRTNIAGFDACIGRGVAAIRAYCYQDYINLFILSSRQQLYELGKGSTFPNISFNDIASFPFPLPPLEEQKRIVAKVDELMRLCDELERTQAERRKARQRLNRAALDQLLAARDAAEFQTRWQVVSDHFPTLTATPDQIGKLRQTVLQLAVQGKLTRQDPQDEPAPALLRRISAERERLVKEKRLKRADPPPPVNPDETPFALPSGWTWARLGELTQASEYGTSQKASEINEGVPVLRMNNIVGGSITFDKLKYLPATIDELPRLYLKHNDLLFNRTNSYELVGKTGIFKGEDDTATFASYLIRLTLFLTYVDADFINLVMNSAYYRQTQIEPEITQQTNQANFNGTKLANTFLPLPPLEEQKRIVAAVNQLMSLCDELEAGLRRAEEDGERLLRAAVRSLLAPARDDSLRVPALA